MTRQFGHCVWVLGLLLCLEATAAAQSADLSIHSFDPENGVAPIEMVEGRGIKIGEGTTIFPVFGAQTGVLSNVFYENSDTNAAGVLRIAAQVGAGSLGALRLVPAEVTPADLPMENKGSFEYRAELRAAYDFLLSSNDAVWGSGGLGIGATLRGMTNPLGTWSFGFNDTFTRLIRAANWETDANTNRDINTLSLNLLYHPPGRSLAVNVYYNNMIDIFERSAQSFADRWSHRVGARPMWRWLPETVVFADVSWGVTAGIGGGDDEARTVDPVPGDHGERIAVHRVVRNRVGHHDGVPRHRRHRVRQPRDRGPRYRRSAHQHRRRPCRGDPRCRLLQPLQQPHPRADRAHR